MGNARFLEILRCYGVDETGEPPTMIVPLGGENQIVLETGCMNLEFKDPPLRIQEYDGSLAASMLEDVRKALSKPGADPQQREAFMPNLAWRNPKFFRILGSLKTEFPGTFLKVGPKGVRGGPPSATLQVAVVPRMVCKVAIRNVRARDAQGVMQYHAKRPVDPETEVAKMNAIWRPQTNIVFELVPSSDLDVDDKDPKTAGELGIAYGMNVPATFRAQTAVWSDKNTAWFAQHKVQGTHITFFVVHMIHWGGDPVYGKGGTKPNGTMNRPTGVSFISDIRLPATFAHEAGHYIGDMSHKGEDIKLLMRDNGAGYKIPFALAQRFRAELAKRPRL